MAAHLYEGNERLIDWGKPGLRRWNVAQSLAVIILTFVVLALAAGPAPSARAAEGALSLQEHAFLKQADEAYRSNIVAFLKKHCLDCHGPDVQEGELRFDHYKTAAAVIADLKTWQRAIDMLRSGAMPPEDADQPSDAERSRVADWIEKTIYYVDCNAPPDPGCVTIRRLNRAEYNNTVRDLVGVTFRPADDFPSDDVGGGFDNLGDVLTLPPLLMEKYLAAAERIAEEAIVADASAFVKSQRRDRKQLNGEGSASYDDERRRWEIASDDGIVSAEFDLPRDGQYVIRAYASATEAGDEAAQMELRCADKPIKTFDIHSRREMRTYEIKSELKGGQQRLSAHFLNDFYDPDNPNERRRDRNLRVYAFEIDGPVDLRADDYPEVHRKLLANTPGDNKTAIEAAQSNLLPFIQRAFRRPVEPAEAEPYAKLVQQAMEQGDTFEQGMQVAVTAVLVSPRFLFRFENDPSRSDPKAVYDLNDFELATRLSYFLWSSMPDDELFAIAAQNKLHEPAILEQQVRRMLADQKCEALVQNFATQWLNLRLLDNVSPDPEAFPDFDAALKQDMRRETELFVAEIIREDKSVLEFVGGRFSYVNEQLAKHYGLDGVKGDDFKRVEFPADRPRSGVLTQASILTLTSNPGRTSPVKRGKWILENILGSPPPDPPPNVPDLESTQKAKPGASLRETLEVHRENAVCASCHKMMDQLGFGLENFDAIGRWREKDGSHAIDSSGELPGGSKFRGPLELASVLQHKQDEFARCLTQKMLTFALGRELRVQDRCSVDKIGAAVEAGEFRFSALVLAITHSDAFRKCRGNGEQP